MARQWTHFDTFGTNVFHGNINEILIDPVFVSNIANDESFLVVYAPTYLPGEVAGPFVIQGDLPIENSPGFTIDDVSSTLNTRTGGCTTMNVPSILATTSPPSGCNFLTAIRSLLEIKSLFYGTLFRLPRGCIPCIGLRHMDLP